MKTKYKKKLILKALKNLIKFNLYLIAYTNYLYIFYPIYLLKSIKRRQYYEKK